MARRPSSTFALVSIGSVVRTATGPPLDRHRTATDRYRAGVGPVAHAAPIA
ncbi:hypothetical protein ABZ686_14145 [Streptomyces sp. NPDC006992]|uniref:hypothetical protein n=1 Tax=Streptomyces sp. NPDC006992 TaxID=3155601 RepID=UPI00340C2EC3